LIFCAAPDNEEILKTTGNHNASKHSKELLKAAEFEGFAAALKTVSC